jgi:hypothetical protein
MITFCKKCGSALDETVESCRDCGMANPYWSQGSDGALQDDSFGLFSDNSHLARGLLGVGALYLSFAVIMLLILGVTPWSGIPVLTRVCYIGAFVLGVGDVALVLYSDPEKPGWRPLAQGILVLNLLGFGLLIVLDRAGIL